MTSLSLSQPADGPGLPVSGAAVPAAAQLVCARGPGAANDAVSGEAATVSDVASAHRVLLLRMPPLVLAVSMAMTHADIWAQPTEHDAAPANAQALGEVRIYATSEKDIGFAPAQAETAGKAPRDILTTPQSVSVVTREQLESRQVNNLQDALQTVAGVSPVNFGRRGFDDIFMRGFRATESVLIDGLVQTPTKWTRLQNYGYERYEVLKGANSVLYGQMQPGGLVNAISKRPRRERMGEVVAEIGNWGYRSLAADYNHPLSESGKTAFRINAVASRSDDPTDQVWRRDRWDRGRLDGGGGPAARARTI